MEQIVDRREDDTIDLGAASVETKGGPGLIKDTAGLQYPVGGIQAD